MTTVAKVTAKLHALDDDFSIYGATPVQAKKVDALEKKLGSKLRPDHRALIETLGACAVIADEKVWPRAKEFEIRPAWQFCLGIEVFGLAPKTAAALDVVAQSKARKPSGKKPFVAAMRRIGEKSCVGYGANGKLHVWEIDGTPEPLAAKSLFAIFDEWLTTLARDKDRMKSERKPAAKTKANTDAKTGEEWLAELLDKDASEKAGRALMKATPALRKEVVALAAQAVKKGGDVSDHVYALARLREDDAALDAIIGYAKKPHRSSSALGVLRTVKKRTPKIEAAVIEALTDENDNLVARAAYVLTTFAIPTAIAPLKKALARVQKNPRWGFGVAAGNIYEALTASAKKGKPADVEAVVEVLTANLKPKERYAALEAFRGLIALGRKAKSAVPKLEDAAGGKDLYLSTLARHALGAITGDFEPHLGALRAAAKNKDEATRSVAEQALQAAR